MLISNIDFSFKERKIFQDFSLSIEKGKVTVILGPSGCGKTTLLNIISGLLSPEKGSVIIPDSTKFSYVFQEHRLLPWKSVEENIHFIIEDLPDNEIKNRCDYYLNSLEMMQFRNYYPQELSGGMKQRAALARAFAFPSNTILLDEPFKGLDLNLKINIFSLFNKIWRKEDRTAIFVTHNIHEALLLGDIIVVLSKEPTLIKEKINNTIPHDKRSLNDPVIRSIESRLYESIMKS